MLNLSSPEHLILMDDPAFIPDMVFPAFEIFDFAALDPVDVNISQRSSNLSNLSPGLPHHGRSPSPSSSIPGLIIPTSDISGFQLPLLDPFQVSSAQKGSFAEGIGRLYPTEDLALDEDLDFGFDDDGNLRDIGSEERDRGRKTSLGPQWGRLELDSAASKRVRREHDEANAGRAEGVAAYDPNDDVLAQYDNDALMLPPLADAEAFPTGFYPSRKRILTSDASFQGSSLDEVAATEHKVRKRLAKKALPHDSQTELAESQLRRWKDEYQRDMRSIKDAREKKAEFIRAKKVAFTIVFGGGIGGVGHGVGSAQLSGPLSMFAGDSLREMITGVKPLKRTRAKRKTSGDVGDGEARRIRQRTAERRLGVEEDGLLMGRGDDEPILPAYDDSELEVGREAQSALDDHQSSAMPWNVSASLHSHRVASSAKARGAPGSAAGMRPSSRLTSASPLVGRGRLDLSTPIADLQDIERQDEHQVSALRFDSDGPALVHGSAHGTRRSPQSAGLSKEEEFEIWGPGANVDTQTAANSQWLGEAMEKESMNFLSYIQNTISELQTDELDEDSMYDAETMITFDALIPPSENSYVVAAHAFSHILSLASKSLIAVIQGDGFDDMIKLGVRNIDIGAA